MCQKENMGQGYTIAKEPTLPRDRARDLVQMMAALSNHTQPLNFGATRDQVQLFFEQRGIDFAQVVENARDPKQPIPEVENLVPAGWKMTPGIQIVDAQTGKTYTGSDAARLVSLPGYHAQFDQAVESLNAAIAQCSFQPLLQALMSGFGSIESFLNQCAEKWNTIHASQQLIDQREHFEDRLSNWMEVISGVPYDKSQSDWAALKKLLKVRHHMAAHPKEAVQTMTIADLAEYCNLFYSGIATTLIRLHCLTGTRVPASIVRAKFSPKVVVV